MLGATWYGLVAFTLVGYVVLDGFDLGAGVLHRVVARTDAERQQVLRTLGPVWDGNEVWLIAGGATLFLAFPRLFAVSFSGFYLPLIVVLWLLAGRALGIELRHQLSHRLWGELWDAVFMGASTLLALFLGVALGNVVRGVTFDDDGLFFAPFFTHFGVGDPVGILDWYTLLVGVTAVAALAHHGALWLADRTDEEVLERAMRYAGVLWVASLALASATTVATTMVQPRVLENLGRWPAGVVLPVGGLLGLVLARVLRRRGHTRGAFLASGVFLVGMLGSAAFGIYPYVLPGTTPDTGLTVADTLADGHGLTVALGWWLPGMALAVGYAVFLYRKMPRVFSVHDAADH